MSKTKKKFTHHEQCVIDIKSSFIDEKAIASVMCTISYRRENYHAAKKGIALGIAGKGRIVLELDKNMILPSGIYNSFVAKREACPKEESPFVFKCQVSRFFLENGEECTSEGVAFNEKENVELVDKDKNEALKLIEAGDVEAGLKLLGQELPKSFEDTEGNDQGDDEGDHIETSSDYNWKEVDGQFKVYKNGSDHCIRSLSTQEDAESYIDSKNIPE